MDIHSIEVLLRLYSKQSKDLENKIKGANSILEKHKYARSLRKLKERMSSLEDEQRRLQQENNLIFR